MSQPSRRAVFAGAIAIPAAAVAPRAAAADPIIAALEELDRVGGEYCRALTLQEAAERAAATSEGAGRAGWLREADRLRVITDAASERDSEALARMEATAPTTAEGLARKIENLRQGASAQAWRDLAAQVRQMGDIA